MNTDAPIADDSRFLSLSELKQAHTELRRRFSAAARLEDEGAAMADEIVRFIERGRATGTMLAEADERWSCQTLLDYWLTKVFDFGRDDVDATLAEFDPETAPDLPDEACPYMGLDAFHEEDSNLFVGRKEFTSQLVSKLGDGGLLLVTGSSGGGKSSAVLAGLIPALKSGALPGSEDWIYCRPIVPGEDPIASLSAVAGAGSTAEGGAPLVIVIDQFEEVFTLCEDVERRRAFSASLLSHVDAGDRIILTIRTDFEPFLGKLPDLQERLKDSKVAITPLSAADLRRAIEEPAEKVGLRFEEGVIERLVDDLVGEPAGLPLLQFTLMMLWKNRTRNRITLDAYEALGGGRLALKRSADKLFDDLIPEEQRTARRIFMKLVKPGEGVEVTRRRVPVGELHSSGEAAERVDRVLARLVDAQLIRKIDGEPGAPAQLEVVHEALVRNWPTLVDWLDEERHALRNLHKMSAAAEIWHNTGKGDEFLYRGEQLSYTEQKLRDSDYDLSPREKEFIQASQDLREAEIRKAKRARVIHWVWTFAVTVLSMFALWKWYDANEKRKEIKGLNARLQKQMAAKPWLDSGIRLDEEMKRFDADFVTSQYIDLYDREKQGRSREIFNRTGFYPIWQSPLSRHNAGSIDAIAVSPDGKYLASGGEDGEIKVWNLETGTAAEWILKKDDQEIRINSLRGHIGAISSVAFSPDRKILASAGHDKTIRLWNLEDGTPFCDPLRGHAEMIACLAFRPSGGLSDPGDRLLIACEKNGVITAWNIGGRDVTKSATLSFTGTPVAVAVRPDGKQFAVGGSSEGKQRVIKLWAFEGLESNQKPLQLLSQPETGSIACLTFSGDSKTLISGDDGGSIRLWDPNEKGDLALSELVLQHEGPVTSIAINDDGSRLASSGGGGQPIRLWDPQSGQMLDRPFAGHRGAVAGVVFASNGEMLLSGGDDGMIKRWTVSEGTELESDLGGQQAPSGVVAISPDGRILASGGRDGRIDLWDFRTGERSARCGSLEGHPDGVSSLAFDPTGEKLVSVGADGAIRWWDWNPDGVPELVCSLERAYSGGNRMGGLEFSPDGTRVASCGGDRFVKWWNLEGPLEGSTLELEEAVVVNCIAISPNGRSLAGGCTDGSIRLWDLENQAELQRFAGHGKAEVTSLAFSPDGTLLASGGRDKQAIIWRVGNDAPLKIFSDQAGVVARVRFSPDGKVFACASDREVSLWSDLRVIDENADLGAGESKSRLEAKSLAILTGHLNGVSDIAFCPDGRSLVSASSDGFLMLWMIGADEPMRLTGLPNERVACFAMSPGGELLVGGGSKGAIGWNLQTGLPFGSSFGSHQTLGLAFDRGGDWIAAAQGKAQEWELQKWNVPALSPGNPVEFRQVAVDFQKLKEPIFCVAMRPTGERMMASGGEDGVIRLCDVDGRRLGSDLMGHKDRVTSLAFDTSGSILASASKDGTVRLWNIGDKGFISGGDAIYKSDGVMVWSVVFDPDPGSRRLAWGGRWEGADHALIIWDLDKGFVRAFDGHQAEIRAIAFDPARDLIASGDKDSTVRLWDLDGGEEIQMLDDLNNMVTGVAFSGDGRLLAASSAGRTPILVWDVASILPIDFKAYATPEKPWLELDDSTYGIRWEASTDRLDRTAAFDYVNLAPASHIGILQRSDFDPSDPAKNAALQDEALFGQFLYARNWNSALVIYGQLRKKGNPAAERAWVTLVEQLQAAAKLKPEGSAAQTLNLLKVKE